MTESSTDSSDVEDVLMNFKKKFKEDFVSRKSNINISINMASTSAAPSFSVSVSSKTVENNGKKAARKNPKRTAKKPLRKNLVNDDNNTLNDSSKDPDYVPSKQQDYSNLSTKEMNSMAKRVRVFHETGIVISDDEDANQCANKYKKKDNNTNRPRMRGTQFPGTHFGQGRIGVCTSWDKYGARKCGCCNVPKTNISILDLCSPSPHTNSKSLTDQALDRIKRREERLLHQQQQLLLRHPELEDTFENLHESDEQQIEVPVLSDAKRAWVERFMDSMSVDRVDYEKPKQSNFVEAVEQKRPSIVPEPTKNPELADSIDAKTIVQRLDFKKASSLASNANDNSLPIATSTPLHSEGPKHNNLTETDMFSKPGPSNVNTRLNFDQNILSKKNDNAISNIVPPVESRGEVINSDDEAICIDVSGLDRSNITLRTPHSRSVTINNPSTSQKMRDGKEDDIMNVIDNLLGDETESLRQEAEQRCRNWLENNSTAQDALHNALDNVIVIDDNGSLDRDDLPSNDSVEIVSEHLPANPNDNSVMFMDGTQILYVDILPSSSSSSNTGRNMNDFVQPPQDEPSTETPTELESSKTRPGGRGLGDCPICWESLSSKEISSTICGHIFCTVCITAAVRANRRCPNCRTALALKKIHPLYI